MNNTGIVRRIDDLGRIVIPKEIRRVLRVTEGDALEIFVDSENRQVMMTPYKQPDYRLMWEDLRKRKEFKEIVEEIEKYYSV